MGVRRQQRVMPGPRGAYCEPAPGENSSITSWRERLSPASRLRRERWSIATKRGFNFKATVSASSSSPTGTMAATRRPSRVSRTRSPVASSTHRPIVRSASVSSMVFTVGTPPGQSGPRSGSSRPPQQWKPRHATLTGTRHSIVNRQVAHSQFPIRKWVHPQRLPVPRRGLGVKLQVPCYGIESTRALLSGEHSQVLPGWGSEADAESHPTAAPARGGSLPRSPGRRSWRRPCGCCR